MEILALEPVVELKELEEREVEVDGALLMRDVFEPGAAIGPETLFACERLGNGSATVIDVSECAGGVKDACGRPNAGRDAGRLNLAVAGEIRTFVSEKGKYMRSILRKRCLLGLERQYSPCISVNTRCWSASSVKLLGFL